VTTFAAHERMRVRDQVAAASVEPEHLGQRLLQGADVHGWGR
jgi:hypothetical protein